MKAPQPVTGQNFGQATNPTQRQPPIEQVLKEPAPSLSAANLQQHQQAMQSARQASVQKNHNSSRAPAAPTSEQPPFPFGTQSPQGLAKYPDRPNGLTQDKLSLPVAKKRKNNPPQSAASTPVPAHGTLPSKLPQVIKNVAQGAPPANPPSVTLKCPVPNCQTAPKGFAAQADLDKHNSEVHEPKEPRIDDPLPWALEQMRVGLNLDDNGLSISQNPGVKVEKGVVEAPKMKASASAQGQSVPKQETSTPMTRVPTQTGPSPASNLLKTPQASANIKTPASEVKFSSKEGKSTELRPSATSSKEVLSASPDPWAGSLVSSAAITEAWSGLLDIQPAGPWSTIQNSLTPSSTLSSSKSERNSPRVSDISENDVVKINLSVNDDSDWMHSDWFEDGLFGDMESLTVNQDFLTMDWDSSFGVDEVVGNVENGARGRKGRGLVVEDVQPGAEWLNVYASESMDQTNG